MLDPKISVEFSIFSGLGTSEEYTSTASAIVCHEDQFGEFLINAL